MTDADDLSIEAKKDLIEKYITGLSEIWKRMIDDGPAEGNPLEYFEPAIEVTEKSLKRILR